MEFSTTLHFGDADFAGCHMTIANEIIGMVSRVESRHFVFFELYGPQRDFTSFPADNESDERGTCMGVSESVGVVPM